MRKKILIFLLLTVLVTAGLFAQGQTEKSDTLKIGAIVPTLNAQFWNNYVEFMKQGADELGVELIVLNCDNKADLLPKYIEDLVSQGVDGMIVVPYWAGDKKALRDTKAANIPLIFTDTYSTVLPQSKDYPNYIAFLGPGDEAAGYQMAQTLFNTMTPNANGKKVVGWVEGTPGTSVAIDRNAGFERAVKEHPEVVVAGKVNGNFVRDESMAAFESLYQANPSIKGVWAANGGTATGVITAIQNAGKVPGEDVLVVGMDLNPENVVAVKDGSLLFDIGGHWLQGGFALVVMYDWLNGIKIAPDKANIKLDLLPLTKDTVSLFESKYANGVPAYDFKEHSRVYTPNGPFAAIELKY